jgi:hypothetical protein
MSCRPAYAARRRRVGYQLVTRPYHRRTLMQRTEFLSVSN